jgi:hypothetical protein
MTRILTICVVSGTVAALALAANATSAATLTPHITTVSPKIHLNTGQHYPTSVGGGALTGRRSHEPLDRAPPVDKASPLNWDK